MTSLEAMTILNAHRGLTRLARLGGEVCARNIYPELAAGDPEAEKPIGRSQFFSFFVNVDDFTAGGNHRSRALYEIPLAGARQLADLPSEDGAFASADQYKARWEQDFPGHQGADSPHRAARAIAPSVGAVRYLQGIMTV